MTATNTRATVIAFPLECGGVICEERRLIELDAKRVLVSVDRTDIKSIRSRFGVLSMHPVLQVMVGSGLALLGYFPLLHLIHWVRFGGAMLEVEVFAIPFALLGLWLALTAFRQGTFLDIETPAGVKRLSFNRSTDRSQIELFVNAIESLYGIKAERGRQ